MNEPGWLIPLVLLLPVIWAVGLLLPIPFFQTRKGAWVYSSITSTLSFALALTVAWYFPWGDHDGGLAFEGEWVWIEGFGLTFRYGLDTISLWMVLLTSFLMPIVVLSSLIEVSHDMRQFHFWLHILEAALMGTFVAQDILLFYVCFEFTLIPLYFLIGVYGHKDKLRAARTFFLFTFVGSMLTFAGVLYVSWWGATHMLDGRWTFDIQELYAVGRAMPLEQQCWVFAAMLAGFGVKTPLFPFHTWLPLAHTEAPTAGSVDLAGLVLKLGPYGLIRLAIPMLPAAAIAFAPWVALIAVIGVIYAALICRAQKDAKRLIAYSSVSHMGFCALGLFAFDSESIGATGAVVYMLSHGLATGGLFLCMGMVYDRFHTRDLARLQGLAKFMPAWSFFFVLFVLASVGLPGLNGFVGEFLTLLGTFQSDLWFGKPFAIVAATGVILAAIYLLYMTGKIVWGTPVIPPDHAGYSDMAEHGIDPNHDHDLSYREVAALTPIAIMCLVIGLYPFPMIRSLEPAVRTMLDPAHTVLAEQQAEPVLDPPVVQGLDGQPVQTVWREGSH